MLDDTVQLKRDLQLSIAYETNFHGTYGSLFYAYENKKLLDAFRCFENLKINTYEDKLLLTGEVSKELIKSCSDDFIKRIKNIVTEYSFVEALNQHIESNVSEEIKELGRQNAINTLQNIFLEEEQKEKNFRKPTSNEIIKLKAIADVLKDEINLEANFHQDEDLIYIDTNIINEINLDKHQLNVLTNAARSVDEFLIAPIYENEDEDDIYEESEETSKAIGIRMVFGIDLEVEK